MSFFGNKKKKRKAHAYSPKNVYTYTVGARVLWASVAFLCFFSLIIIMIIVISLSLKLPWHMNAIRLFVQFASIFARHTRRSIVYEEAKTWVRDFTCMINKIRQKKLEIWWKWRTNERNEKKNTQANMIFFFESRNAKYNGTFSNGKQTNKCKQILSPSIFSRFCLCLYHSRVSYVISSASW